MLGGGVVACEMTQVFAALGSSVTVIERGDRLLGRAEPVASALVRDGLKRAGATVRLGISASSVSRPSPGGPVTVSLSDGSSVTADEILCALGRTPRTEELGLDSVGAKVDGRGFVEVDDTGEVTSVPGQWLYAVGDVNGRNLLTHMGKYQGRVAGDVIAARAAGHSTDGPGMAAWADHLGAPQVVFTDPEVASAGLTEAAARAEGRQVRVVDVDLASVSGAGLQADDFTGAARMVVDAETRVVLGATFVGQDVAEMAHAAAIAVHRPAHGRHAVARHTLLPHDERGLAAPPRGVRAVTARPPEIDLWDAARARAAAPGLWRVYDEVFGDQDSLAIWRQEVLDRHSERDGFRLAVARCEHEIVGFAYGYVGERGQPWADRVAAALPPAVADEWVGGHFELVDLAVLESHRRHGGGRRLHDVLMDGETRRALLSTDDADTPAVLLYRSRGWQRLGQLSEGVQIMGLRPAAATGG